MLEALARAVDDVVEADASLMCDSELRESFVALRASIDRLEASAARLLARVHGRGIPSGDGASSTPVWVQWQTGQRQSEAKASLQAGQVCASLPLTEKAWSVGAISGSAARAICRGIREGHEDVYVAIEDRLIGCAGLQDLQGLDGLIRHYQTRADALDGTEPADLNGLHLSQVGNRWTLKGDFDELAGMTHDEALSVAMDKPVEGDTRSLAKRRADASTRIHRFFLDHAELPVEGGERPHVSVVVNWETIRDGATALLAARPGESALSPAEISRLLCDARVSLIVFGPDSVPLDVGRAVYRPSKPLRRAVVIRDRHCRFPGCRRRARWCEAHHVDPFPEGETTLENLVLLCDYHHHLVHKPGWRVSFDGVALRIVNPEGRLLGADEARPRELAI